MNREGFEAAYLDAFWELQRLQWENYAEGASHGLSDADASLYSLLVQAPADLGADRRGLVLRSVISRGLVDHNLSVAGLRNRLDDWTNYRPIPATITARWRTAVAGAMEPDLVALVETRNHLSREEGFASYGDLAMRAEGLDLDRVTEFVTARRAEVLPTAADVVAHEGFSYDTWFGGLDRLGGPDRHDGVDLGRSLAAVLGLEEAAAAITWVVRDQPIHGYAGVLDGPADVRILLRPRSGIGGLSVAFHELGHAVAHASNRADGIFQTWSVTHDETMACVVEHIGARLLLTTDQLATWELLELLEAARLASSFLFEVELSRDPSEAQTAFVASYEPLVSVVDPVVWAVDSFRSIDPFRVHAYLIGDAIARATIAFLTDRFGDDHASWGRWLVDYFFADGRRRPLLDKVAALEDFCPGAITALSG